MKSLKLPPVSRTAAGLRDALFDEINGLRSGQRDAQHAKVVAQLAHRIIEAARLQLQVSGHLAPKKDPLRLGNEK